MNANKVKLRKTKGERDYKNRGLPKITHMLPYYKSTDGNAKYFHRVRSADNHWLGHTSISNWCGQHGFISNGNGKLYSKVPDDGVLCATCEGRAIGAGLDGARVINGKEVMYSPRKTKATQETKK